MKKAICAAAVVFAVCPAAFAVEVLLPNGSFEANGPQNGFNLAISNWTATFTGAPADPALTGMQTGLFGSYGKFAFPAEGTNFVTLSNLGGGTVTLTSGASGVNFLVNQGQVDFRWAYISNDAPGAGARDQFRVRIDFFATATSTTTIGTSIDVLVADSGQYTDSAIGLLPYRSSPNNADAVYNNAEGTTFWRTAIDTSSMLGSFARISFIVNNAGPAAGTNGNGLGVSGIVLDNVLLSPEPGTIGLFALGALGLGGAVLRRRSAKKTPVA